jgi:AcrR family transcriptional regulator
MASEKKIGRPRDERARHAVLDTVRAQLRHNSLCTMSMEGIAREAGVGKQTLYRWWPTLADVALEALIEDAGEACKVPETGNPVADLRAFLSATFQAIEQQSGCLLRCLMVEAQKNADFRTTFRERFIRNRQEALEELLQRHQLYEGDVSLLIDMIFGAMWYRLLVGHRPLDDELAEQLTSATVFLSSQGRTA